MCEDRVLDGPASEDKGPYPLTPNTVELFTPCPLLACEVMHHMTTSFLSHDRIFPVTSFFFFITLEPRVE